MRRPVLQSIIALGLAALFAAPVAAVEPGGAAQGDPHRHPRRALRRDVPRVAPARAVRAPHEDRVDRRSTSPTARPRASPARRSRSPAGASAHRLEVASARPGPRPEVLASAEENLVRRRRRDRRRRHDRRSFSTAATVTKNLAIVLINFKDNTSAPFSKSTVQSALTGSATSIKAFFEEESKSRWSITGTVFGWYTLDTTSTTLRVGHLDDDGRQRRRPPPAAACGLHERHVRHPRARAPCGWAGVAYVNGSKSVMNGNISVQVMTHELGHNFGLGHANALYCTNSSGTRVAIAATPTASPRATRTRSARWATTPCATTTGRSWASSGSSARPRRSSARPATPTRSRRTSAAGPVKLVRVPRGDGTFFDLDFRDAVRQLRQLHRRLAARCRASRSASPSAPRARRPRPRAPTSSTPRPRPPTSRTRRCSWARPSRTPRRRSRSRRCPSDASGVKVQVKEGIAPSAPGLAVRDRERTRRPSPSRGARRPTTWASRATRSPATAPRSRPSTPRPRAGPTRRPPSAPRTPTASPPSTPRATSGPP